MTDREKVITHLDDMRLFADTRVHQIVSPENWEIYSELCNFIDLVKEEILDLLKEQEEKPYIDIDEAKCPICKVKLTRQELLGDDVLFEDFFDYCPHCGKAVKWND